MKNHEKIKNQQKARRVRRVRSRVVGRAERPRLCVYRSNKHLYAQAIDDTRGITLCAASDKNIEARGKEKNIAREIGKIIATSCQKKGISQVVFDRREYKYHGKVKEFAEGAREGGLQF